MVQNKRLTPPLENDPVTLGMQGMGKWAKHMPIYAFFHC